MMDDFLRQCADNSSEPFIHFRRGKITIHYNREKQLRVGIFLHSGGK